MAAASKTAYRVATFSLPGQTGASHSYVVDAATDQAHCTHLHEDAEALKAWMTSGTREPCPTCDSEKSMLVVQMPAFAGAAGAASASSSSVKFGHPIELHGLDPFFFDLLNKPRDHTAPDFVTPEMMYGTDDGASVSSGLSWRSKYRDFGITEKFVNAEGDRPRNKFHLQYDVWEPKDFHAAEKNIPTLVLTHGVPMNRREWYPIARILARFMRVITVDILGMGESSMPLDFQSARSKKSYWSWGLQARMFSAMFKDFKRDHPEWFMMGGRLFFAANDWGSAVVQKHAELFGDDELLGAGFFSALAFDGYWVQHIGSLQALALLPYPSPTFTAETVRFAGVLTGLLETMFKRTPYHTNQYNMALYQFPYVEISYSDVTKNPGNTKYHEHAVRVLAQQAAAALGNGELLPFHQTKNPNGMRFSRWNIPLLVLWGAQDKMMPEGQRHRFALVAEHVAHVRRQTGQPNRLSLVERSFEEAGHFAIRDQPIKSAHEMISWIRSIVGPFGLHIPYMGLEGIARQDEQRVMASLKRDYAKARKR